MPTYIFNVSRAGQVDWDAAEFADGETLNIEVQRSAEVTGTLFVVFSDTEGGDALVQKAFTGNAVALRAADMILLEEGGTWFADIVEVDGEDQYRVRKGRVDKLPSIALGPVGPVAPSAFLAPTLTPTGATTMTATLAADQADGGSAITDRTLSYTVNGGAAVTVTGLTAGATHTITGLSAGDTVVARVDVTNAAGTTQGATATAQTWQLPAQMSAPTLVGGTGAATLEWPAAPNLNGRDLVANGYRYEVTLAADTGFASVVESGQQADLTDISITPLAPGSYIARVWAVTDAGAGVKSAASTAATIAADGPALENLTATVVGDEVTVSVDTDTTGTAIVFAVTPTDPAVSATIASGAVTAGTNTATITGMPAGSFNLTATQGASSVTTTFGVLNRTFLSAATPIDTRRNVEPRFYARAGTDMITSGNTHYIAEQFDWTLGAGSKYLNLLSGAWGWTSSGGDIVLDANDYPVSWTGSAPVSTIASVSPDNGYPYDNWYLVGRGKARLRLGTWAGNEFETRVGFVNATSGNTVIEAVATDGSGENYWAYPYPNSGGFKYLYLFENDLDTDGDGLRDVALIHVDDLADYMSGVRLRPEYIATWKKMGDDAVANGLPRGSLRTMTSNGVNSIGPAGRDLATMTLAERDERWKSPSSYSYSRQRKGGLWGTSEPYQFYVQLCNEAGVDLWWNWPADVTDEKVTEIVGYIYANLRADLKVIWEYGNEVWNSAPGFSSYYYCVAVGEAAPHSFTGGGVNYEYAALRYGQIYDLTTTVNPTRAAADEFTIGFSAWQTDSWDGAAVAGQFKTFMDCTQARLDAAFTSAPEDYMTAASIGAYIGGVGLPLEDDITNRRDNDPDRVRDYTRLIKFGVNGRVEVTPANIGNPVTGVTATDDIALGSLLEDDMVAAGLSDLRLWDDASVMTHIRLVGDTMEYQGVNSATWEPVLQYAAAPTETLAEILDAMQAVAIVRIGAAADTRSRPGFMIERAIRNFVDDHVPAFTSLGLKAFAYEGSMGNALPSSPGTVVAPWVYAMHASQHAGEIVSIYLRLIEAEGYDRFSIYRLHAPVTNDYYWHEYTPFIDENDPRGAKIVSVLDPTGGAVASNAFTTAVVDFTRDKVVFDSGAPLGNNLATVPLSGTTNAPDGSDMEVRWVAYDDTTDVATGSTGAWQTLSGAVFTGAWSGNMTAPRNTGTYYRAQARVKNSTAVIAETNRFAAGHVVDIWGQSELARSYLNSFVGTDTAPSITDAEALQFTACDGGWGNVASMIREFVDGSRTTISRRLGPLANMLAAERPGEKFHFNFQTVSSTGVTSLVDDTNAVRAWSNDMAMQTFAYQDGQSPGLAYKSWFVSDGSILGAGIGRFWTLLISGLNPQTGVAHPRGTEYTGVPIDHFFTDIYDYAQTKWALATPHRYEGTALDLDVENVRIGMNTAFENPILSSRAVRVLEPLTYRNTQADFIHPEISADGMGRFMTLVGYGVLQGLGLAPAQPVLDQWFYDDVADTLTIGSSAGPLTTTRIAQGEALPSGYPKVAQVFKNGTTISDADISIVGGQIIVSNVVDGDIVAVGAGGIGTGATVGTDDLTELNDNVWKDWPIVDVGNAALEGLPVRGLGTPPEGTIPALPLPPDSNTNPNLLTAQQAAFDPAVWTTGVGWTANNDGTATFTSGVFQEQLDLVISPEIPEMNGDPLLAPQCELRFVPTSPEGGTRDLIVTVTSFGGGSTADGGAVTLTMGEAHVLDLTNLVAARSSTRIRIEPQSTPGTLVINDISIKQKMP